MRRTIHAMVLTALITALCAVAPTQMGEPRPSPMSPMIPHVNNAPVNPKPTRASGPTATIHFQTNIGSFKTIDSSGRIAMTFKGTVLLSGFEGKEPPTFQGDVALQYTGHDRQVYFGSGTMTLDGSWRGIQWFGRDLKAVWTGAGMIRLVGEFDKNLDTGTFYYDNPKAINYWPTSVTPTFLPERKMEGNVEPRERSGQNSPPQK